MKKLTLLGVVTKLYPKHNSNRRALLTFILSTFCFLNSYAQKSTTERLFVGDRIPDIQFDSVLNYSNGTATISQLQSQKSKLLLFDFWFTSCSSCIEQFPKLDSLQKKYEDRLQIVLVAHEPSDKVIASIQRWEKRFKRKLDLPIVVNDKVLHQYFPHKYEPHYLWIAPDRVCLAETAHYLVEESYIRTYLDKIPEDLKARGFVTPQ